MGTQYSSRRAKAGEIKHFTGIDDPYEIPEKPDLHLRTDKKTPEECANALYKLLSDANILCVKEVS